MADGNLFQWLARQEWAQYISGSIAFGILESLHVAGQAILIGSIAILDLRLLGIVAKKESISAMTREVVPWTWTGFAIVIVSGFLLFAGAADRYVANPAFQVKLLALVLAGANMAVFHRLAWRNSAQQDSDDTTRPWAVAAGSLSLLLWVVIVAAGRWIAFT